MDNPSVLSDSMLVTLASIILAGALSSAVQNKIQGDDVLRSLRGGLAGGIVSALAALATVMLLTQMGAGR